MAKIKKLPGVLSFQRCLVMTDGLFYSEMKDGSVVPLPVMRHGIRGTQNVNKASKKGAESAASAKREEVSNIQTTDSAKTAAGSVAAQVRFSLRGVDVDKALFACAPGQKDDMKEILAFKEEIRTFLAGAKAGDALDRLALRYVRNIANGRFLWRNRAAAAAVSVRVDMPEGSSCIFDALSIPLHSFTDFSEDEKKAASVLARGWKGDTHATLRVTARMDFGMEGPVEVFPSQNYLENKARGFARPLYCVGAVAGEQDRHAVLIMGQAALRDQKIGNALRTVDTWYPGFTERNIPIPVEPNGASLDAQLFFRNQGDASGFKLLLRVAELDPLSDEGQFLLACLIRGGVFSGSD